MPRIGWIVDNPIYHFERLRGTTGHNANVLIVRDSHVNIIQRHYPHIDFVDSLYHGGFICSSIVPYSRRQIDVSEDEFRALEYIMRPLDLYQRAYMRTHIIENLLKI